MRAGYKARRGPTRIIDGIRATCLVRPFAFLLASFRPALDLCRTPSRRRSAGYGSHDGGQRRSKLTWTAGVRERGRSEFMHLREEESLHPRKRRSWLPSFLLFCFPSPSLLPFLPLPGSSQTGWTLPPICHTE